MNLGSPDSPEVSSVRRYLRQFLMDKRVLDINPVGRSLLVHGLIVPFRSPKSAKLYQGIWTESGSPLLVHSYQLQQQLQRANPGAVVTLAMRYGTPSAAVALDELRAAGVTEALLLPLYPHYAMSSYETAVEDVLDAYRKGGHTFPIRTLQPYFDDTRFLDVLADSIRPYLEGGADHVLFSYHGIPERQVLKTDPTGSHCLKHPDCCTAPSVAHKTCYRHQCFYTTKAVAERLQLEAGQFSTSFQSRLGRTPWLQPYTAELLPKLPAMGIKKLVVVCPAFSADCLETLEEMDVEGRDLFLNAGGATFRRVPCLNTDPAWVATIQGWLDAARTGPTALFPAAGTFSTPR